jgi:hypothetical protein
MLNKLSVEVMEWSVEVMERKALWRGGRAVFYTCWGELAAGDTSAISRGQRKSGASACLRTGVCSAQTDPHTNWVSSGLNTASRQQPVESCRSCCLELVLQMTW